MLRPSQRNPSMALAVMLLLAAAATARAQSPELTVKAGRESAELERAVRVSGTSRVIVAFAAPVQESSLSAGDAGLAEREMAIGAARARLLTEVRARREQSGGQAPDSAETAYSYLPIVALTVDAEALQRLAVSSAVLRLWPDRRSHIALDRSVTDIGAAKGPGGASAIGDGTGTTIAILDTGLMTDHPFLAGRITHEACFSANRKGESASFCPARAATLIGAGAARPCAAPFKGCHHGTHVAGIAAGRRTKAGGPARGVAPGAKIVAVQIFSASCDASSPCSEIGTWDSDVLAGLNHVLGLNARIKGGIAAVNLSIGTGEHAGACDDHPTRVGIEALRAAGVAVVVSSDNAGRTNAVGAPGCVSAAITVAATTRGHRMAAFSNMSPLVDLLAPGVGIVSSVPGGGYQSDEGTSMAAPHVTGAIAILKARLPRASVDEVEAALKGSGIMVRDDRPGGEHARPRIRVDAALARLMKSVAGAAGDAVDAPEAPPPRAADQPPECRDVAERGRSTFASGVNEQPTGCR